MERYGHIIEKRRNLADLPLEKRINICLSDIWIPLPHLDELFASIQICLEGVDQIQSSCMLIHGESGFGKTAIIHRLIEMNAVRDEQLKLISFGENPSKFKLHELLMSALDIPAPRRGGLTCSTSAIAEAIKSKHIRGLLIDELQDALYLPPAQQKNNISLLKHISGMGFHLSVIAFGDTSASRFIGADVQAKKRYTQWQLDRWDNDIKFRQFVLSYHAHFPLREESSIDSQLFMKKLHKLSRGKMDNVVKILKALAAHAIQSGAEKVVSSDLDIDLKSLCRFYGFNLS